jgi:ABC-2 type transport system ATP-binding protein
VDVEARAQLLEVVRELAAAGSAILYSTHYLAEVEDLGASVAILDRGRVVARDSLPRLIGEHGSPRVEVRKPSLESAYMAITGHGLAAGEAVGDGQA